jgi:hypothetical protein
MSDADLTVSGASKPWYVGLRKWSFAVAALASVTACAVLEVIDGAQYLGALAGVVGSFLTANVAAKKVAP